MSIKSIARPEYPILFDNFGNAYVETDITSPIEMQVELVAQAGGISLHFKRESIPLSLCVLERHGDTLTVFIELAYSSYNGSWDIPVGAYQAICGYAREQRKAA